MVAAMNMAVGPHVVSYGERIAKFELKNDVYALAVVSNDFNHERLPGQEYLVDSAQRTCVLSIYVYEIDEGKADRLREQDFPLDT